MHFNHLLHAAHLAKHALEYGKEILECKSCGSPCINFTSLACCGKRQCDKCFSSTKENSKCSACGKSIRVS